jgi:adenosylmethionine-8-amino-7-oxononanoate aminotransferase
MYFSHGFTYSGHAVACAVGLKNMEIIERDGILEHVREVGPYFEEQLKTLEDLGIVGEVRGNHLMIGIECVANKETRELLPDEVQIAKRITRYARERGLIIRPLLHLLILSPPLIITREQIDTVVQVLRESIKATQDDLVREGIWSG